MARRPRVGLGRFRATHRRHRWVHGPPARRVGSERSRSASRPPLARGVERPTCSWQTQPGSDEPVAYDPCRPIHVVVNERTVIGGAGAWCRQALDAVSRATGLQFVVDGPTDEAPSTDREAYQPDRYGKRWAPVLIAWSDPTETPELAGDVAGLGGSASLVDGEQRVGLRHRLDRARRPRHRRDPDPARRATRVRAVIEHELGPPRRARPRRTTRPSS